MGNSETDVFPHAYESCDAKKIKWNPPDVAKLSMKAFKRSVGAHAFIKTTYDISLDSQICLLP